MRTVGELKASREMLLIVSSNTITPPRPMQKFANDYIILASIRYRVSTAIILQAFPKSRYLGGKI